MRNQCGSHYGRNDFSAVHCGTELSKVLGLRPTLHKIGHFGDVLPSQSLTTSGLETEWAYSQRSG